METSENVSGENVTLLAFGEPLRHDLSQYMEMGYQSFLILVGMGINVPALVRILRFLHSRQTRRSLHFARLANLSLHLIIANLAVLAVQGGKVVWISTLYWHGGDALCRLFTFASNAVWHLASNMVTAIAVDLFVCIRLPFQARVKGRSFVRRLIFASYAIAALFSFPSIFLKSDQYILYISGHQCYADYRLISSANITIEYIERVYGAYHLMTIFYLPLAIIIMCYIGISLSYRSSIRHSASMRASNRKARYRLALSEVAEDSEMSSLEPTVSPPSTSSFIGHINTSVRSFAKRNVCYGRVFCLSAAIVATYIVTWSPYQIYAIFRLICQHDSPCSYTLGKYEYLQALMLLSTCINPFFYNFDSGKKQAVQAAVSRLSTLPASPYIKLRGSRSCFVVSKEGAAPLPRSVSFLAAPTAEL